MNDISLPQPSHSWEDPEYSVKKQHSLDEASLLEKGVDGTTKVNTALKVEGDTIGVTFAINSENLTIEGFTFKADGPDIYPPLNRNGSEEMDGVNAKKYNYWSTFQPAFMAQIAAIMIDLMKLQTGMAFKESQVDLMQRDQKIHMAETMAELTKLLYDAQAMEQMIQAIGSFTNAAIGAIQLVSLASNMTKATDTVGERIKAKEKHIEELEKAKIPVGAQPEEMAKAKKAATDEINAEKRSLDDMKASKQDAIYREGQRLDQLTSTRADILKQCVNGMTSMMASFCKTEQGAIQALKDTNQGIADLIQVDMQDASKNRDALEAALNKLVDLLKNMFDSNIRAKMIKG